MPKKTQVSLRGQTHAKLKARAEREGITVKALLDRILEQWLRGEKRHRFLVEGEPMTFHLGEPPKPRDPETVPSKIRGA